MATAELRHSGDLPSILLQDSGLGAGPGIECGDAQVVLVATYSLSENNATEFNWVVLTGLLPLSLRNLIDTK